MVARARFIRHRFALFVTLGLLFIAAGCGSEQEADPSFDPRVAHPAYAGTHPVVLFEDGHHTPHTSTGRCRPLASLLRSDGYTVRSHRGTVDAAALERADVYVVVNPGGRERDGFQEAALTSAECDAIAKWVAAGGSLLLVADHEPYGLYARDLARRFGVEMSGGVTADSLHQDPTGHDETQFLFSDADSTLGTHPILAGRSPAERVRRVRTYTGQSLGPPPGATPLLLLHATAVDYYLPLGAKLVQARKKGRVMLDGPFPSRGSCQGLALENGRGRVVVLGEAAEITAQRRGSARWGMTEPGADNRQFALNIAHWLSRLD